MIGDIDIRTIEAIKEAIEEFSKRLIEEASNYSKFRADLIKIAIAMSLGKYRIMNPQELKGLKRESIETILFVMNCFERAKAIIKTKKSTDRIIEIRIVEDEEVQKMLELMKIQYEVLQKRFDGEKEKLEKEIERTEKEYKDFKNFMIEIMVTEDKIHYLQDIIFFYGDLEDVKDSLEIAKAKGKDVKAIAKELADIYDPEGVLYCLYKVDKKKAEELAKELNIDFEKFKREFEIEA